MCDKGVFSSIILSQLRRPIEFKFWQVCYFMHVEIHQVRRLVFDIYQRCPVPLNTDLKYEHFNEISEDMNVDLLFGCFEGERKGLSPFMSTSWFPASPKLLKTRFSDIYSQFWSHSNNIIVNQQTWCLINWNMYEPVSLILLLL